MKFHRTKMDSNLVWLEPGLSIKRWLLVLFLGLVALAIGAAYLLKDLYSGRPYPPEVYFLTLQFLPRWTRALVFGVLGLAVSAVALRKLYVNGLKPILDLQEGESLPILLLSRKRRERGPKVVAIGGGHGLSSLLHGLRLYTENITAIVTVADDGGSSGRLRRDFGILPPGDFRNCIAALSDAEDLVQLLFQYRFGGGIMGGHSFGNLFITAIASITGSFEEGLKQTGKILAVHGEVLPSTLTSVTLCADVVSDSGEMPEVCGESRIPGAGGRIVRAYLRPKSPPAYPEAIKAILEADAVVVGPGSLYTSILPNLLVPDIARAIRVAPGKKIYVCNVATQKGETEGFSLADHVEVINDHLGFQPFHWVIANDNFSQERRLGSGVSFVRPEDGKLQELDAKVWFSDLVDDEMPWRHDPLKLAEAIVSLLDADERGENTPRKVLLNTYEHLKEVTIQ